ncbi:mechanosensitive ion channel family protein [Tropicimonas isoalkanivorans]|uniref:Small-conductance mechanosensitive channel n=1 Tax=Tropicimonas isoalkanivorans TaxID=441112 RepID=A0A1I1JML2_9RHOB|nr:mechanosensitive ion channel family protein [Tropicimonas isoalkanivorans]SFC49859.1 Small-conductance mechanosensitive channel [Tropicimonas isoalkanivorans]
MDQIVSDLNPIEIVLAQVHGLAKSAIALLPSLAAAVFVLLLTALVAGVLSRIVRALLRRSGRRPSLVTAAATLARLGIWVVGLLTAATILFPNLTPTKMLAGLGIGSIAVGLAFQDIFENFLAGFLILLRKPMRIGDDIECGEVSGRVEEITIRDSFIRQRSGELLLVPNSFLYKNPVKVVTDQSTRRVTLVVGVAYSEDVDASREVIRAAVEGISTRVTDKEVQVFAREFNSSSVDFLVRWWCDSAPPMEHRSRDEAVAAIKRALDENDIEIPFPYRTLTFNEPIPVALPDAG